MIISSRQPLFWVLLSLLALSSIAFTFHYFSKALPIVNVDIKINRSQALEKGTELAKKYSWGEQDFRQAATFDHDGMVQLYVELEAGGNEAFAHMIQDTLYSPFTWHVRRFKEGETNEVNIFFKPDGTFYGFQEKIAESTPGAHLTSVEARTIAETCATTDWGIDLNDYSIIETSQETQPNGRIDHTFVYERPTIQVGEGRYRLALGITGDKCTKLRHFIKIPEGFHLRYDHMRSKNKNIKTIGLLFVFLYIVTGCIALAFLMRQGWVLWAQSLLVAAFFGLLSFIYIYNKLPLTWMNYDTATGANTFLFQFFLQALMYAFQMFLLYGISFTAGECLTRKAFGHHIQFWKSWNKDVASSWQLLGRTIGGYLFAAIDIAIIIGSYYIALKVLGWWAPSDQLTDPNIIATYIPWIDSFYRASQAGFFEEMLFRAIPLSCAALIGEKYGKRNIAIVLGLIAQALIFGIAHSDYPQQPAYFRIVEMFLPSVVWGIIYVCYGLIPIIIIHFLYDFILMSLPIFVSSASGSLFNQGMIVMLSLIPLGMVIYARLRTGAFKELSQQFYNYMWQSSSVQYQGDTNYINPSVTPLTTQKAYMIIGFAFCSLIAWLFTQPWKHDELPLPIHRSTALQASNIHLHNMQVDLPATWRNFAVIAAQQGADSRFVWQTVGKNSYQDLMQAGFIKPPMWIERYATFEGDLEDRAEQYFVSVGPVGLNGDKMILRTQHILPEKKTGAQLTEDQARKIAEKHISPIISLGSEMKDYKEISAVPTKHPNRTDWIFTYEKNDGLLKDGTLRASVAIAGDAVVDTNLYVHIPEEWERNDRNERTLMQTFVGTGNLIYGILTILIFIYLLLFIQTPLHNILYFFVIVFILYLLQIILSLPITMFSLKTSQPITGQLFRVLIFAIIGSLASAAALTTFFNFIRSKVSKNIPHNWLAIASSIGIGIILQSILETASFIGSWFSPSWASYNSAPFYLPWLATALWVVQFIGISLFISTLVLLINYFGKNRSNAIPAITLLMLGIITCPIDISITLWLSTGLAIGLLYYMAYRFLWSAAPQLVIWTIASSITLKAIQHALHHAYPGATLGYILGIIATWLICFYLYKEVNYRGRTS